MNRDNAHLYLPLVQALADGRTIEIFDSFTGEWEPDIYPMFVGDVKDYRIKPEPKTAWYRVGQARGIKNNVDCFCVTEKDGENCWENLPNFIRWLTERVTYEVTE